MDAWTLVGFEVEERIGSGSSAEVWRAREVATGQVVALKRVREGAPPGAVAALHREAALLDGLDTPYVVRVRGVVDDVLVLDHAAGGSLAALLSRRGTLEPGEVVTVAAPLASALACAHARGLVHGDLSPANVLFTSDGMPLLADLGAARVVGEPWSPSGTAEYVAPELVEGGPAEAASDVWALAALCHQLLCGMPPYEGQSVDEVLGGVVAGTRAPLGLLAPRAPRALVEAVEAGLVEDPALRPSSARFGLVLQQACAAVPVRLSGAPPVAAPVPEPRETHALPRPAALPDEPAPARRWALPSPAVLVAALVVVVLLAGGLTWALTGGGPPAPAALPPAGPVVSPSPGVPVPAEPGVSASAEPSPGTAEPGTSWAAVLDELDAARERAFAAGDPGLLDRVYVQGSDPASVDALALAALTSAGRTAAGVRHEVRAVTETSVTEDRAQLRVVDVLAPQQVLEATGAVVSDLPGRPAQAHDVLLLRVAGSWLISALGPVLG